MLSALTLHWTGTSREAGRDTIRKTVTVLIRSPALVRVIGGSPHKSCSVPRNADIIFLMLHWILMSDLSFILYCTLDGSQYQRPTPVMMKGVERRGSWKSDTPH